MVNATYITELESGTHAGNATGDVGLDEEVSCEEESKNKTHKDVSEMKADYKLSGGYLQILIKGNDNDTVNVVMDYGIIVDWGCCVVVALVAVY